MSAAASRDGRRADSVQRKYLAVVCMHAIRQAARRRPEFVMSVLGLGIVLGLGATAVWLVDSVFLKPLPFRSPEQLSVVHVRDTRGASQTLRLGDLRTLREVRGVLGVAGFVNRLGLFDPRYSASEGLRDTGITEEFFDTLGTSPMMGPAIVPPFAGSTTPSVFISYALWHTRFTGDVSIVGRIATLGDRQVRIAGVMPRGYTFPDDTNVWTAFQPPVTDSRFLVGIVRQRPGHGGAPAAFSLQPIAEYVRPQTDLALHVVGLLMAAVIAIVIFHLVLQQYAAGIEASGGLRLRIALGATTECLAAEVISVTAATVGLSIVVAIGVAALAVRLLEMFGPVGLANGGMSNLGYGTSVGIATGLVVAAAGIRLVSIQAVGRTNPSELLRVRDDVAGGRGAQRLRTALLLGQGMGVTAISVVCFAAGHSVWAIVHTDLGFDPKALIGIDIPDSASGPVDRRAIAAYTNELPGVAAFSFGPMPLDKDRIPVSVTGRPPSNVEQLRDAIRNADERDVGAEYLRTVGTPVVVGRPFRDGADMPGKSVILSMALARSMADPRTLPGRTIYINGGPVSVVGVAADVRGRGPTAGVTPYIYVLSRRNTTLIVRYVPHADVQTRLATIVRAVAGVDGPLRTRSGAVLSSEATATQRQALFATVCAAFIALIMTYGSVFGQVALLGAAEARDNRIRLALGAHWWDIAGHMANRVLLPLGLGAGLGLFVGVGIARYAAALWPGAGGGMLWAIPASLISVIGAATFALCRTTVSVIDSYGSWSLSTQ